MTKFCMLVDTHDIITCATFCDDRLRGLGVARGRISSFPIDLRRRPYNSRTTVRVCGSAWRRDAQLSNSVVVAKQRCPLAYTFDVITDGLNL